MIRFIAEYEDGSTEPFDVYRYDLRSGDFVARIVAGERQRDPIGFRSGRVVRVYRDAKIAYL